MGSTHVARNNPNDPDYDPNDKPGGSMFKNWNHPTKYTTPWTSGPSGPPKPKAPPSPPDEFAAFLREMSRQQTDASLRSSKRNSYLGLSPTPSR